jgi:hypothetical protein
VPGALWSCNCVGAHQGAHSLQVRAIWHVVPLNVMRIQSALRQLRMMCGDFYSLRHIACPATSLPYTGVVALLSLRSKVDLALLLSMLLTVLPCAHITVSEYLQHFTGTSVQNQNAGEETKTHLHTADATRTSQ